MNRDRLVDVSDAGPDTHVSEVLQRPSRLRTLAELGANAQTSAEALDRIARVACRVLSVPVALVNLIGADRQHFVGCDGPEPWGSMRGMPIDAGFCPFALTRDAYTLEDARKVPAHAGDPAVELGVVAYAGVPLRAADGEPIGTLCAVDFKPRAWSEDDLGIMTDLAAGVVAELQLLTATRMLARDQTRLRSLAELSSALAPAESVDDVLGEVSRSVDRLDTQAVWVSLVDDPDAILRTAAASQVVRTGEPGFLTTQAEVREGFAGLLPDARSVAVVPLSAGEERLGVLGVCFADERPLPDADREYLTAVGGVSGLALAHARR
jgi:GAF domain-containing protein